MNIEITKGFVKKAKKNAEDLLDIPSSKRLKSNKKDIGKYVRIRLGDYRVGIELTSNTAKLITIGDRKEIYRNFP